MKANKQDVLEEIAGLAADWERLQPAEAVCCEIMRLKMLVLIGPEERSASLGGGDHGLLAFGLINYIEGGAAVQYAAVLCGLDEAAFDKLVEIDLVASRRWYNGGDGQALRLRLSSSPAARF